MKAIILAAGRGSRLGPLTAEQPKCLTVLNGRPLLDWQLDALAAAGIGDVTVIRGYRAETLNSPRYATCDNPRWAETNMVRTLCQSEALLSAHPALVLYSDIVYHPDHVRALARTDGDLSITYDTDWQSLWSLRFADPLSDAETFRHRGGQLMQIGGRAHALSEIEGQYMGLLKFTPRGWQAVRATLDRMPADAVDRLDMTSLLARLLEGGQAIRCVPVQGRWCEVDNGHDLAVYEGKLRQADGAGRWRHDWRWGAA